MNTQAVNPFREWEIIESFVRNDASDAVDHVRKEFIQIPAIFHGNSVSHQFNGTRGKASRFQHDEGLQRRIRSVSDGEFDVVNLTTLHSGFSCKGFCVSVGAYPCLTRIVVVVFGVGHVVDRTDGYRPSIGSRNFCDVDGAIGESRRRGVITDNARPAQEKGKNVVVLGVDKSEVLVRTEYVVE